MCENIKELIRKFEETGDADFLFLAERKLSSLLDGLVLDFLEESNDYFVNDSISFSGVSKFIWKTNSTL